jgi:hypothetical protein
MDGGQMGTENCATTLLPTHARSTPSVAGVLLPALVAASCAAGGARAPSAQSQPTDTVLFVTDAAGNPVSGAKVSWTRASPFYCQGLGRIISIYDLSGDGTTDSTGQARFGGAGPWGPWMGTFFGLLVIGKNGEKTLSSLPPGGRTKIVTLLPAARVDLALRCEGGTCPPVVARGTIERDGGKCEISYALAADGRLTLAGLPEGDLELRIGLETERPTVYRTRLVSKLSATVNIATLGGAHVLSGRVLFPDGSPAVGAITYTSVTLACANGQRRSAYADASTGAFEFRAVAAVPCTISAERAGTWQSPPIQVSPGRTSALTLILAETDRHRRP